MLEAGFADSSNQYNTDATVSIAVVPENFTAAPLTPDDMPVRTLTMANRSRRPYPPGLVLVQGSHWYNTASAISDDFDLTDPQGKDLVITWESRNKETQGLNIVDHYGTGIVLPDNAHHKLWLGYYNTSGTAVTLLSVDTDGTSYTVTKAQVESFGRKAGYGLASAGSVTIQGALNTVNDDGLYNWQGYGFGVLMPSYPVEAGDTPGTGNSADNQGSSGGGTGTGGGTAGGSSGTTPSGSTGSPADGDGQVTTPSNPVNPDPEADDTSPGDQGSNTDPTENNGSGISLWSESWDTGWAGDSEE